MTVLREQIPELVVPGKRLGRHIHHDSRSLAYRLRLPEGAVLRDVNWARHIPILDQGQVGSCTGNAMVGALGSDPLYGDLPVGHPHLAEAEALRIYSEAEVIDGDGPYPPNDNGSSGLSVCQAAKNDGLISGYTHSLSVTDFQVALQSGPVLLGCNWYDSFDSPDFSGLVSISPNAVVRGGHEVVCRVLQLSDSLIALDNSWGLSYGVNGMFAMKLATLDRLLGEQGDGTCPVPISKPAPVPDADHVLWGGTAQAWCREVRVRPDLIALQSALRTWATAKNFPL
jgi:hypothetical protein